MKTLIYLILLSSFFLTSCYKTSNDAVVVKNCTGVYLKFNNKVYQVCEDFEFEEIEDGTTLRVHYTLKMNRAMCSSYIGNSCKLNYPFDYSIYVTKIFK